MRCLIPAWLPASLLASLLACAPPPEEAPCGDDDLDCGACGDGVRDLSEGCDDANTIDDDGCEADCFPTGCGDGTTDADFGEECDDGNHVRGDGCGLACEIDRCGDGVRDPGEECDDGDFQPEDGCDDRCRLEPGPNCGDFVLQNGEGEQCDDGNHIAGDGCSPSCRAEQCGDHVVQPTRGEECEDDDPVRGLTCVQCRFTACGNGVVDGLETCDDDNTFDGDGCSSQCRIERCGDFFTQFGEDCDDGNALSGDGCSPLCRFEQCNDGIVQPRLGELCDDGNGTACNASCNEGRACIGDPEACVDARSITRNVFPSDVIIFDADGDLDLDAIGFGGGSQPSLMRFQNGVIVNEGALDSFTFPFTLAALDFDGDGDQDLVGSDFNPQMFVLEQNQGTWTRHDLGMIDGTPLDFVGLHQDSVLGHFATVFGGTGRVVVCRSVQTWVVDCEDALTGVAPTARLAAFDLDVDGDSDLLVSTGGAGVVLRNDVGVFVEADAVDVPIGRTRAADVDGDGDDDLFGADIGTGEVLVLTQSEGSMTLTHRLAAPAFLSFVVPADLGGDGGAPDLVGVSRNGGTAFFWMNDGAGPSVRLGPFGVGARPASAVAGDLNGDGRDEIVVPTQFGAAGISAIQLVP